MDVVYPPGPAHRPDSLATPTPQYHRHSWIAMLALCSFAGIYALITGWLLYQTWVMGKAVVYGDTHAWWGLLVAVPASLLALFMLKALFFVRHSEQGRDIELTAAEQPRLFAFLHRLADEAKAPRPHRVFISAQVNAAVFYDLSLLNLVLPSRKNLVIGLGLINVLNLSEFKAVLAHEFGHFAQRSMAVGRWVYTAQQVMDALIVRRDRFDRMLRQLSNTDLRLAWVGWGLRLMVWSIRSLLETLFQGVMLAQRALSREMELQADLVAVSLTGSDALVHALYRIQAADEAWERALDFANHLFHQGRLVSDIYPVQTRILEHLERVRADPHFASPPQVPAMDAARHRVFRSELAQAPRMWRTHPHNHEREENAKRTYVPAPLDARPAWTVFDRQTELCQRVTRSLAPTAQGMPCEADECLRQLDRSFEREAFNRRYHGAYLGHAVTRAARTVAELYDSGAAPEPLNQFYPSWLEQALAQLHAHRKERYLLQCVHEGRLSPPGGMVAYRGRTWRKSKLPELMRQLQAEIDVLEGKIADHHRRCRSSHRHAAGQCGSAWQAQLHDLLSLVHYAEHTEANLRDAQGFLRNRYAVVTADGKVSRREHRQLLQAALATYQPLAQAYAQMAAVMLNGSVVAHLEARGKQRSISAFNLPEPNEENLPKWLDVIDGWVDEPCGLLADWRDAALDELLVCEARIAQATAQDNAPLPVLGKLPERYTTLLPGQERALQKKLGWWDRFQTANGLLPATLRLMAAATVLAGIFGFSAHFGDAKITMHNGLSIAVVVESAHFKQTLAPFAHATVTVALGKWPLHTRTQQGQTVDAFTADATQAFAHYVYNVASADRLVEWTAVYGDARAVPAHHAGAPRWSTTLAEILFEDPPESISLSKRSRGGSRLVLSINPGTPSEALSQLPETDRNRMLGAHARWDTADTPHLMEWLSLATQTTVGQQQLQARLADHPDDVFARRAEQDSADAEHAQVCARHIERARQRPADLDWLYLATRCHGDGDKRSALFLHMHKKNPHHAWFALAAGHVWMGRMRWSGALAALEHAGTAYPALADAVAVDMARAKRALTGEHTLLESYARRSPSLRQLMAFEKTPAYQKLAQGRLLDVLPQAQQDFGARPPYLLRLLAASDGAPSEPVDEALALQAEQGIAPGNWGASFGFALRHRQTALRDYLVSRLSDDFGRDAANLKAFAEALQAGDPAPAERSLREVGAFARGQAYVAGIVYLGKRAPRAWREFAQTLLFANERPYFQAP